MGTILKTELLKKYYGTGENQVRALDGIDLSIEDGEFIAVVGTSGSGKSTLLHMLGGLDRPTSGKVYVDGKDIFSLKDDALCVFRRRKIGFVFQSYNLVPVLNVEENICLPSNWTEERQIAVISGRLKRCWESRTNEKACRDSSPAGSSREWRLRGRWQQNRRSYWQMNRREIWIPEPVRMCWDF